MEQLTIQSLIGFLIGFQEDIKVPRPHGTINRTVIDEFLIGFKKITKSPGPMEQLTIQSSSSSSSSSSWLAWTLVTSPGKPQGLAV